MPSPLKKIYTQQFYDGRNSDVAPEHMPPGAYRYMLNCNVLSTPEGNVGVVTNIKGNTSIPVVLPSGENRTIGVALDEENNKLYYAVWNSEGYHTWYMYDYVANKVNRVIQSRTDSNDTDIFKWDSGKFILHADVIGGTLLSWSMEGHPPRKIDIGKAMDKSDAGYGTDIPEEFTRVYKRAGVYSPQVEYFTDEEKKFNLLYRRQFKFAYRWLYDNDEKSDWSEWSPVPNPVYESFMGEKTIPTENNGLKVIFETGPSIVVGVEIAVQTILDDGSISNWSLVDSLNKSHLNIPNNDLFEYSFYNEGRYTPVDQTKIIRNYSFTPRDPACQSFTKNAMVYTNFTEGFPPVDIDIRWDIEYDEVYLDGGGTEEENNPAITYNKTDEFYDSGRRAIVGELIIGSDVKRGNIFEAKFVSVSKSGKLLVQQLRVVANTTDSAATVASKMANQLRALQSGGDDYHSKSYVNPVVSYGGGSFGFSFRHRTEYEASYWQIATSATPVSTVSLEDNGQSVRIIKNGSSAKYGIVYYDDDGRKSLVYSNDSLIVGVDSANELGGIMAPKISFNIHHNPPVWAKYFSIVRTADLVYDDYIYVLIQKAVEINHDSGESYYNLSVGSLFTYQRVHPNTTLKYDFKQGDRIRVMYDWEGGSHSMREESRDFEILSYSPQVEEEMNQNITVDDTSTVTVESSSPDFIGSWLRVNDVEREIIAAPSSTTYELSDPIATGNSESSRKFPGYVIINKRGVIRVGKDDDYLFGDNCVVVIYTPSSSGASNSSELFSEFGKKFNVLNWNTDSAAHEGNIQNQSPSVPATIEVSEGSAYVRQRALPLNNAEYNPQVAVVTVEDQSYSDYYHSNMTDDGKVNSLDTGQGIVRFDSRSRWSNNYIEGTKINGLNDFDNLDREDYNDQYGAVMRTIFANGRINYFKHLKVAHAAIYANRITDEAGASFLASSDRLLPRMLEYFLWDGGVGNNPESVTRNGNNILYVSPDSGVVGLISYNGVEPISITYSMDSDIRKKIAAAKSSNAPITSWFDRRNGNYEISFGPHDIVVYQGEFIQDDWEVEDDEPVIVDKVFYGQSPSGSLPSVSTIEGSDSTPFDPTGFTIPFVDGGSPTYYWIAYPDFEDDMTVWSDPASPLNAGTIGSQGGLFRQFQAVGSYKVVITRYPTQMVNMKFSI